MGTPEVVDFVSSLLPGGSPGVVRIDPRLDIRERLDDFAPVKNSPGETIAHRVATH